MVTKRLKKVEVSYLIVNYKQKSDLDLLLKDIGNNSKGLEYEVLIFDNSTELVVNDYSNLFCFNKNIGYGKAVDYLSTKSEGDYLIIINPDVRIVKPLKSAISKYKKLPLQKGLLGLGKSEKQYITPLLNFLFNKKRFSGYAFIIHKQLFKSTGGFDPHYFMYFEDSDLFENLKTLGIGSASFKKPFVIHTKTYTNISSMHRKYYYYNSLIVFLSKHKKTLYYIFAPFIKLMLILPIYSSQKVK